jgi:dienelactone hydrolase
MRRLASVLGLLGLLIGPAEANTNLLPGLIREPMPISISLPDGRQVTLEGMVIRPDQPGRFPLVVLVHGTPGGAGQNFFAEVGRRSPAGLMGPAVAFAQRGYVAVSIMRRGFVRSDGPFVENVSETCSDRNYLEVAQTSAEDVTGAVSTLRREPWVDADRVVLLGLSTGGLAVTASAAAHPQGVIGILDFAGGHGSNGAGQVCGADRLVEAFAALGHTARIPALWVYAENDRRFRPELVRRMFDAYVATGATARLDILPPFGSDGHDALIEAPTELWWPPVEAFLTSLQMPTQVVIKLPPPPPLPSPLGLNGACLSGFISYVAARTEAKAFAVSPHGHCGWVVTSRTLAEAQQQAMARCSRNGADCTLYAAGHALVSR